MEAGTDGLANYERLTQGYEKNKNKLYYYSAVEQYVESTSQDEVTVKDLEDTTQIMTDKKDAKNALKEAKERAKEIRKSGKLKFKDEDGGMSYSGTVTKDVPWTSGTWRCNSAVPCYDQPTATYNGVTCVNSGGC